MYRRKVLMRLPKHERLIEVVSEERESKNKAKKDLARRITPLIHTTHWHWYNYT